MATPSLALGIGLQGKPIDRAAFNMQREIGAQKALQRKQEKELKELDPFKKQLVDLQSKAYLPAQKELLARETAKVYKYMADNIGNVDQWQLSQMVGELANRSGLYQRNYVEAEKLRNNPKYQHIQGDIEKIFTVSSPEEFNNSFSGNPAFAPQLNELGGLVMQPFEAKSAQTTAQEFINIQKDNIFGPPSVETIDGIQKEVYRPKEGTFESVLNFTIKDPTTYRFEASNLFNQLAQSGNLPDLKTPKGQQQFDQMVKEKIANDIRSLTEFADYKNVPKKGGTTFNIDLRQGEEEIMQPTRADIPVNVAGLDLFVETAGGVAYGDQKMTLPFTSETFYTDGQQVETTGEEATYNLITSVMTLDKDFVVPETFVLVTKDGRKQEIRKGTRFPKGHLIPKGVAESLFQAGGRFSPKIVAVAQDGSENWFYTPADMAQQSRFSKASEKNKEVVVRATREQERLNKYYRDLTKKYGNSGTPAPAPTNPPKVDTPSNSKVPSKWNSSKRN